MGGVRTESHRYGGGGQGCTSGDGRGHGPIVRRRGSHCHSRDSTGVTGSGRHPVAGNPSTGGTRSSKSGSGGAVVGQTCHSRFSDGTQGPRWCSGPGWTLTGTVHGHYPRTSGGTYGSDRSGRDVTRRVGDRDTFSRGTPRCRDGKRVQRVEDSGDRKDGWGHWGSKVSGPDRRDRRDGGRTSGGGHSCRDLVPDRGFE